MMNIFITKMVLMTIVISGVGGYVYNQFRENESLNLENKILTEVNKKNSQTIVNLGKDLELLKVNNKELNEKYKKVSKKVNKAVEVVELHDLELLLYKKPGLVIPRINNAIKKRNENMKKILEKNNE